MLSASLVIDCLPQSQTKILHKYIFCHKSWRITDISAAELDLSNFFLIFIFRIQPEVSGFDRKSRNFRFRVWQQLISGDTSKGTKLRPAELSRWIGRHRNIIRMVKKCFWNVLSVYQLRCGLFQTFAEYNFIVRFRLRHLRLSQCFAAGRSVTSSAIAFYWAL